MPGQTGFIATFDVNWERTEPLAGKQINQPALFIHWRG